MAAKHRVPRIAPEPVTTVEEILVTAHTEACEQHRQSLIAVKDKHLTSSWLEFHDIENARRAAQLKDEELGQLFTSHFEAKMQEVGEALWNDGYRQACEDLLTEVRAYMKGLN